MPSHLGPWQLVKTNELEEGVAEILQCEAFLHGDYVNVQTGATVRFSLGRIRAVQASYVAVVGHQGLSVLDPLHGTVMWQKPDVSVQSHVFGDAEHVFVAESKDGSPIFTRQLGTQEIYALTVKWP